MVTLFVLGKYFLLNCARVGRVIFLLLVLFVYNLLKCLDLLHPSTHASLMNIFFHFLFSNNDDPFNRQHLTLAMVEPNRDLLERIKAWKNEKGIK